jgi:hypothetical protein
MENHSTFQILLYKTASNVKRHILELKDPMTFPKVTEMTSEIQHDHHQWKLLNMITGNVSYH